jgi:hypothetical protein
MVYSNDGDSSFPCHIFLHFLLITNVQFTMQAADIPEPSGVHPATYGLTGSRGFFILLKHRKNRPQHTVCHEVEVVP